MQEITIGFLGAGGLARAHAFALTALPYYYDNVPAIRRPPSGDPPEIAADPRFRALRSGTLLPRHQSISSTVAG